MDLEKICYIKSEFLIPAPPKYEKTIVEDNPKKRPNDDVDKPTDSDNSEKIQKLDDDKNTKNNKKNKNRGQNKHRPIFKEDRYLGLCHSLHQGPAGSECTHENCKYVHDLKQYFEKKPKDIADTCYIYTTKGFCPRGVTCRFASAHLDENLNNKKADFYNENAPPESFNGITSDLQIRLRKRNYDFSETTKTVQHFEKLRSEKSKAGNEEEKPTGCVVDDEEIQGRDSDKPKRVDFSNKLVLSPLTTVGNLPFRRICKEFGADITCGEMACAVPLVKGLTQEWALTKRHVSEDIFGVQLCGNSPKLIGQAAQLLRDTSKVDYIDLNIGCPIDLIYQQGGGSALMRRSNMLEIITRSCSQILGDIPFTVKMRTGVYADKSVAHELFPKVEEWGASAVTIHGRSREQRYTKTANWEYIEQCASKVRNIPVIGNGDILSYEDYNERKKIAPHVSSVMIGRGALIKPWIFKEIKEQKTWDPSSTERFELLQKYVNYGLEHWGSDTKGVENTRRFLLEWQSFLYRYIPVGVIETPPQKINQRPQWYRGRDEMETLMSSGNCADWIKISEMLLGPVPEGFTFLPKHKANSY